jgi:hypothetical protein
VFELPSIIQQFKPLATDVLPSLEPPLWLNCPFGDQVYYGLSGAWNSVAISAKEGASFVGIKRLASFCKKLAWRKLQGCNFLHIAPPPIPARLYLQNIENSVRKLTEICSNS